MQLTAVTMGVSQASDLQSLVMAHYRRLITHVTGGGNPGCVESIDSICKRNGERVHSAFSPTVCDRAQWAARGRKCKEPLSTFRSMAGCELAVVERARATGPKQRKYKHV